MEGERGEGVRITCIRAFMHKVHDRRARFMRVHAWRLQYGLVDEKV